MPEQEKLPNVFIVGTQKSGTTTLFNWLGQHPEVFANPEEKDFPFFTDNEVFKHEFGRFLSYYKSAPVGAKVLLGGEANLMYVPGAVERMHSVIPRAKLIVVLRNPVARCFSGWRYAVERDLETRSFERAVQDELDGIEEAPDSHYGRQRNYLAHGLYVQQLELLQRFYPNSQIRVVIYEDLVSRPEEEIRRLFDFIGVDTSFLPEFKRLNETLGGRRFAFVNKLVYSRKPPKHRLWGALRRMLPTPLRGAFRRWLVKMNRVPAPRVSPDEATKRKLQDYYAADLIRLERLLGMRLEQWRK